MHVAIPTVIFLFCYKIFGRKALPAILYPVVVMFSTVYLGEHYLIDGIAGMMLATAVFLAMEKFVYKDPEIAVNKKTGIGRWSANTNSE